ncbi:MAG: cytochrome C [Planctomycetes bacterium]|nr:cytochrome C [Planctomycetota bacterium]
MSCCAVPLVALALLLSEPEGAAPPPADRSGNCTTSGCHDGYAKLPAQHAPVRAGTCDACHEVTDKEAHKFRLTSEPEKLCGDCHEAYEGKVLHRPVKAGECLSCHDPHAAELKGLLRAKTTAELCSQCHEDLTESVANVHGPVAGGACTTCHAAHDSDHPHLLRQQDATLCVGCHSDTKDRLAAVAHLHAPVKDGCLGCHAGHGGDNKMFLRSAPPDLCLGCHNKETTVGDRTTVNLAKRLAENPRRHGPVKDGNCAGCHDPHGGAQPRLLTGRFPDSFYAPFRSDAYELCFQCHEAEAFEEKTTDSATGFRNGERNLHYLHVNKSPKGRTCRVCHDVHAAKGPALIVESAPFGQWKIPITYRQTENGGSCLTGCHRPYGYDRESPVANGLTP